MRDNPKTIEFLNAALKNELTAINQYFLHSRMLKDWGVTKLAQKEYEESIEEMNHADWIIERILFLNGLPNLQDLGKLFIGEDVAEIIECDLNTSEEEHLDYLETQQDQIRLMGIENYIQSQSEPNAE